MKVRGVSDSGGRLSQNLRVVLEKKSWTERVQMIPSYTIDYLYWYICKGPTSGDVGRK